jgi:hypothetical protein
MQQIPEHSADRTQGGLTRAARLTAWGNALLGGYASPDDAAEAIRGGDERHVVREAEEESGLTLALGRLRARGVTGFRLALPVPGHPLGLTGPPEFNALAMDTGEAVLTVGDASLGLVPEVVWHGTRDDGLAVVAWSVHPVREAPPADVPTLREAERELAEAMRETTEMLLRMDVGGAGPEVHRALQGYRSRGRGRDEEMLLAPGYPQTAARVLESARRVRTLIGIAGGDDGAAVSAAEMAARAAALQPLDRAARRAEVAAHNAFREEH